MAYRAFWFLVVAGLSGCATTATPHLLHPGPAEYQQRRAERFDPYPETDVGPNIAGGRPLQYDRPAPENERSQNDSSYLERYRQPAPPGLYHNPRTNTARQGILYTPPLVDPQSTPVWITPGP